MTSANTMGGDRHAVRNVVLLAVALALSMTGTAMLMTASALAGQMLAIDKRLATLPLALQFTVTMLATIPASFLMRRIGRKAGFILGQVIGGVSAAAACYAILAGSFWMFAAASAVFGAHVAFWQYYRFAAAETATEAFRSRAISLTLSGGVAAALVGPELAKLSNGLFDPVPFAGVYGAIAGIGVLAIVVLRFIRIPPPLPEERRHGGRPLGVIARQPAFVTAVLAAAAGYGVMSLVMTATPVAMVAHDHVFDDAAFVIQWHIFAMFAPSFITGTLIRRFGVLNVILVGAGLMAACVAVNLSGVAVLQFLSALVFLGLGWNLMFVGGTTLLTEAYAPEERAKVQALNDFLVFGTVAVASFSSGALLQTVGWEAVNIAMVPPVVVALVAVLWMKSRPTDGSSAA